MFLHSPENSMIRMRDTHTTNKTVTIRGIRCRCHKYTCCCTGMLFNVDTNRKRVEGMSQECVKRIIVVASERLIREGLFSRFTSLILLLLLFSSLFFWGKPNIRYWLCIKIELFLLYKKKNFIKFLSAHHVTCLLPSIIKT